MTAPTGHSAPSRPPRDPVERSLCDIFAQVLGHHDHGPDDDFFDHGGHSLLVVALVNGIRRDLGADIALRWLFEETTPAGLARRMSRSGQLDLGARTPKLVPRTHDGPTHLAPLQRGLWLAEQLAGPGRGVYNLPLAFRLEGPLDVGALRRAVAALVRRHEVLRTRFPVVGGAPQQHVDPEGPGLLTRGVAPDELITAVRDEASRGFDLATEPGFRATLYAVGPRDHVLLLVLDHLVGDGPSWRPLLGDLGRALGAREDDESGGLATPVPSVQYRDYAVWHQEVLGDPGEPDSALAQGLAFWSAALVGMPDQLRLPCDRARPNTPTHRAGELELALSADRYAALVELARQQDATVFMVLVAGLATVLTRLGAGHDIPLGTPVTGRVDAELDDLVGYFVNTVVLRTDTSGRPTFAELVRRVRENVVDALAHAHIPLDAVVRELRPERRGARQPLFQTILVLEADEADHLAIRGVDATRFDVTSREARFDLEFVLREESAGLRGVLRYATDLFDDDTARELADRWSSVMSQLVTAPHREVECVDPLLDPEKDLVRRWRRPGTGRAGAAVTERFQRQVMSAPDAPAVDAPDGVVTYRELGRRVDDLAAQLRQRGVSREHVVGVALRPSLKWVVAVLAVMEAGATYLPIDTSLPEDRVRAILLRARTTIVLADGAEPPADPSVTVWHLDDGSPTERRGPRPARPTAELPVAPDDLAYVIFTSGSTGRPQGVLVTHRGLVDLAHDQIARFALTSGHRVLQIASVGFDATISELVTTLLAGAELVLRPRDELTPGGALTRTMVQDRITHVTLPPVALPLVDPQVVPTLVTVVSAGEALPAAEVARWAPVCRLINAYGPTESTVCATMSDPLTVVDPPTIGTPREVVSIQVLDETLHPVARGVPGELYLGGPSLARGYLGAAGLTAARFVADPHGDAGDRLYRTGDRVSWDRDRQLTYLGRNDRQVSVRGFRVELAEVEEELRRHPDVVLAVVQALSDEHDRVESLVAHVVVEAEVEVTAGPLRTFLSKALPSYAVPSHVVVLDRLPLTPNGKVDVQALPAPTTAVARVAPDPASPREEVLRGLVADTLGRDDVAVNEDFFTLGGHSMQAAELVERIRATFGVELGLRAVFEASSVGALAGALERSSPGGDLDMLLRLRTGDDDAPIVCVHPAVGLGWSFAQLARRLPDGHAVYALQSVAVGLGSPRSVRALAEQYVDAVAGLSTTGRFRLVGWSVGGLVAHEMAVLLHERGRRVELLAVLDAYPPSNDSSPWLVDPETAVRAALAGFQLNHETVTTLVDEYRLNVDASRAHRPSGVHHGDLVHFRARGTRLEPDSWTPYVTGLVRRHSVDVAHDDMCSVGSAAIAATLSAALHDTEHTLPDQETS